MSAGFQAFELVRRLFRLRPRAAQRVGHGGGAVACLAQRGFGLAEQRLHTVLAVEQVGHGIKRALHFLEAEEGQAFFREHRFLAVLRVESSSSFTAYFK